MATLSTPERITAVARDLDTTLTDSIEKIRELNERTHVLAINARIEAARAGVSGRGFRVVADAFGKLNVEIQQVSQHLTDETRQRLESLLAISGELAGSVRGERIAQWADSVMDVVDRNLYERSCDVRWWATEAAVIRALEAPGAGTKDVARNRLATILDSYTVYFDIVVADTSGRIVVNGRPGQYAVEGRDVSSEPWFRQALSVGSQGFGFQSAHRGALAGGEPVLIYSSPVCAEGRCGDPLGVIGVVFRWEGLGRITLEKTASTLEGGGELLLVEPSGRILATTSAEFGNVVTWAGVKELLDQRGSGYRRVEDSDGVYLVARGVSTGFETYATGWSCLIRQKV